MLTYQGQAETNAEAWFNIALRPRKPEGSLGRSAQDGHLDYHTTPELCELHSRLARMATVRVVIASDEWSQAARDSL